MEKNYRIYVQDHGWAGVIAAVAETEEEAREYMKSEYNYAPSEPLEEVEIKPGMILVNIGDL